MIQTDNMTIDPEMCKRLDAAIYGSTPPPAVAVAKADLYRIELVTRLTRHDPGLAAKVKNNCLYNIYCWLERVLIDEGQHVNERMHANGHTAHMQLKNWK